MSIGQKIKQLRKERIVSPDMLGKYVGYKGRQGIYDIESGKIKRISNEMIKKFAEFFNLPVSFFYDDENIIEESDSFYRPSQIIDNLTVSSENMASLLEENRQLWRENAILKRVIIENNIDISDCKLIRNN